MAASAGIITIDVAANVAKLIKGMDKAEKRTEKAFSTMKKAALAMAAIFGAGQLIGSLRRVANEIDSIAKTSDRLGIATDALIGFRHAAELSGLSVQTLEMSMQRMTRRVAQDAQSSTQALEAMNIPLQEFKNMNLEQQMYTVADGLQGITSQSERVSIAFKLFDSEGVKVLSMLQNGSGALKNFKKDANDLGLTMDRSMAAAVEASNDAMYRLKQSTEGLYRVMSVALAPYITIAANAWVDYTKNLTKTGQGTGVFSQIVARMANGFIVAFNAMRAAYNGFLVAWALGETVFYNTFGTLEQTNDAFAKFTAASEVATASVEELTASMKGEGEIMGELNRQLAAMEASYKKIQKASEDYAAATTDNLKKVSDSAKSVNSNLVSGISGGFRQMMDGSFNFKDAVGNMAKSVVADLIKILIVQKAINAAMGISPTGGVAATGGASAGVAGSRASGGGVSAGRSYLVGERGAEVFTPSTGGQISSAEGTTVNIYNNTPAEVETRETEGGIDVIVRQLEPILAEGVTRRTSPLAGAILGLNR